MPSPDRRSHASSPEPRVAAWRQAAAAACALAGLAVAGHAFWDLDLRYARPTPAPPGRVDVERGARVELPDELARYVRAAPGPTLLHVFNPECPCSRFNLEHVVAIARELAGRARVVAVLQGADAKAAAAAFEARDTGLAHVSDPDGSIAASVGAYSTPQAAIVDRDGRLLWRGNYNVSRFCRDRDTEFARIALEHAVAGRDLPAFPADATIAYGCALPGAEAASP